MSVLSRIQWHDRPTDGVVRYLSDARTRLTAWATGGARTDLPDGESLIPMADRERTVSLRPVSDGVRALNGVEGIVRDRMTNAGTATRWTLVVRVAGDDGRVDVMVENRMETSDPTRPVRIERPRVVDDLLAIPGQPRLGALPLLSAPEPVPAGAVPILIDEVLRLPGRLLPVIVCTQSDRGGDDWLERAHRIAERTLGFANVFTLDRSAAGAFRRRFGGLAVWDGGVRIYSQAPLDPGSNGLRHRRFPPDRFRTSPEAGVDRVVAGAAALSARLPAPPALALFSSPGAADAGAAPDRVPALEADLSDALSQADALGDELEERDNEVNRLQGHLARLREELERAGMAHLYWGAKDDPGTGLPDTVQDIEEAVLAAQFYLTDYLRLPDKAKRGLDRLATAPQAVVWGNTAWRGLRSLAAYARHRTEDHFQGGFWEWCDAGFPESWPATDKKLSMSESETVQNTPKFNNRRLLPVSTDVDRTGKTYMYSHLKVAEGGSDLAPRIYFYDDTHGNTGKIHVGFIGPHYLMPNTKS